MDKSAIDTPSREIDLRNIPVHLRTALRRALEFEARAPAPRSAEEAEQCEEQLRAIADEFFGALLTPVLQRAVRSAAVGDAASALVRHLPRRMRSDGLETVNVRTSRGTTVPVTTPYYREKHARRAKRRPGLYPLSSLKVSANVGRGIKNPSFSHLYGSQYVDGDLSLLPEEAVTVDAGAELTFDDQRWLARFTWFNNDYENQIAYSPSAGRGGDGVADYVNIDGSRADGVELEFGLQRPIGGLTASASYALVDTEVVTNVSTSQQFQPGQPLLRRPLHSSNLRVGYTRGRGSLHLNLRVVGDRHDNSFLGLQRLSDARGVDITVNPGYTLLTAGGQFRVRRDLTLFLRIDNLTNTLYDSALGYPALPRAVVAGGRFDIGG